MEPMTDMTDDDYDAARLACVFCDYAGPSPILWCNFDAFVIEPLNPVTPGHVLVVSRYHIINFADDETFTAETMNAVALYAQEVGLGDANLITSKGAAATQTIEHLHVHLVPRREGDGLRLPWAP
jgi:histidine triad (HIT) family protein